MTFKIGLTGGIGSGKSSVASAFANLGVPIFCADDISHELSRKGEPAYLQIVEQFGLKILLDSGELNRACLGDLVFNDNTLKSQLEGILHPLIMQAMHEKADATSAPYVVLDIPLLIGTPEQSWVDRILVVDCERNRRTKRVMKRNGWSVGKIEAIMSMQASEKALLYAADDIIDNNAGFNEIEMQVTKLHLRYLGYSRSA